MAQAPEGDQPTPPPASGPPPAAPQEPKEEAAPAVKPDSGAVKSPFASGIRPTSAMTAIKPEDLDKWKAEQDAAAGESKEEAAFLEVAAVQKAAEDRGLVIDPGVYAAAIAALASGRHLVLTGGAGSGKTSLASAIAEAASAAGRCKGVVFTSAASGFSAFGRKTDGGKFEPGLVPAAIEKDKWVVIDELDRIRLDRALGRVSTVLGGHPVDLPGGGELKPGSDWRVIGTMRDIDQVGRTSPALRRRFVFVEVPVLERGDLEKLAERWASGDEVAAAVGKRLVAINDVIELGPGLYKDAIAYVAARRKLAPASETDLTLEALAGFVLPQLEGEGESVQAAAVEAAGLGA